MNMCFFNSLTIPNKCLICKVDYDLIFCKKRLPKNFNLFSLTYAIG